MKLRDNQSGALSSRHALLSAQRTPGATSPWRTGTGATEITMRPFLDIGGESYSTYQQVMST
jgi:hypothetical protein